MYAFTYPELFWGIMQWITLLLPVATVLGYRGLPRPLYVMGWMGATVIMVKSGMWSSNMSLAMAIGFTVVTSLFGFAFGIIVHFNKKKDGDPETPLVVPTGDPNMRGWKRE